MPRRTVHDRDKPPTPNIHDGITEMNFRAVELSPKQRELLRLLYDCPLVGRNEMAVLIRVSRNRLKQVCASLVKKGLVHNVELGESYEDRRANGTRLALSNAGLRLIGWMDRRRTSDLAKHWRINPSRRGQLVRKSRLHRFEVQGTKLRTLIGDLHHTDADGGEQDALQLRFAGRAAASQMEQGIQTQRTQMPRSLRVKGTLSRPLVRRLNFESLGTRLTLCRHEAYKSLLLLFMTEGFLKHCHRPVP